LIDQVFDAQTSGGLVLAVPDAQMDQARDMLLEAGDLAAHIGQVSTAEPGRARLNLI
jgi:selenide,water dikinase